MPSRPPGPESARESEGMYKYRASKIRNQSFAPDFWHRRNSREALRRRNFSRKIGVAADV